MLNKNHKGVARTGRSWHSGLWHGTRQLLAAAVVAVMVAGGLLVHVEAAIGDLDTSFSTDGRQTTNFNSDFDLAYGVAIQSDGKIVVAGYTFNRSTPPYDFAVARYNTNGTPDTSFDMDGRLTTDFSGGDEAANAVAIQADGKIVVVGFTRSSVSKSDFAVARYNSDGSLDTTFNMDGLQTTDFYADSDDATAVAIQANGKIVVAGYAVKSSTGTDFAVARYYSNGDLDTTFNMDGLQTTDLNSGSHDRAFAVAIQANSKIVLAGVVNCCSGADDFALARYNGNGDLDKTFSDDGIQTTDFRSKSRAWGVAIQSDGKIVAAGEVRINASDNNFALARYNGNGSLDDGSATDPTPADSFGTGGKVKTDFFGKSDIAYAIAIQTNGKIVAAGYAAHANNTNPDFAVARYTSTGILDTTFSGNGLQHTNFFNGSTDYGQAIAIQSDGKIVVAGYTVKANGNHDFAVARYLGD